MTDLVCVWWTKQPEGERICGVPADVLAEGNSLCRPHVERLFQQRATAMAQAMAAQKAEAEGKTLVVPKVSRG